MFVTIEIPDVNQNTLVSEITQYIKDEAIKQLTLCQDKLPEFNEKLE